MTPYLLALRVIGIFVANDVARACAICRDFPASGDPAGLMQCIGRGCVISSCRRQPRRQPRHHVMLPSKRATGGSDSPDVCFRSNRKRKRGLDTAISAHAQNYKEENSMRAEVY